MPGPGSAGWGLRDARREGPGREGPVRPASRPGMVTCPGAPRPAPDAARRDRALLRRLQGPRGPRHRDRWLPRSRNRAPDHPGGEGARRRAGVAVATAPARAPGPPGYGTAPPAPPSARWGTP